jgi:comEA protein
LNAFKHFAWHVHRPSNGPALAHEGACAFPRFPQEDVMDRRSFLFIAALALGSVSPLLAQTPAKPVKAAKPTKVAAAASTEIINLNTATATQIATLPGIGPKTADLVVQYRQKNGPYKKIEEIMNVRGVGEKSFLKLKSRLTVTPSKAE